MPIPRVIELRDASSSTEAPVEADYDKSARKKLIKQLQLLLFYARRYRNISLLPSFKLLFLMIENKALKSLYVVNKSRYLLDWLYCDFSDDRHLFVQEQLYKISQQSKLNACKFQRNFRMSRNLFMKLWLSIKDHPVFLCEIDQKTDIITISVDGVVEIPRYRRWWDEQ